MVHGADALLQRLGDKDGGNGVPADAPMPRNRIVGTAPEEDTLVLRLAADRLRELRDDGVTLDYVARMYGVGAERMEILYHRLIPSPHR